MINRNSIRTFAALSLVAIFIAGCKSRLSPEARDIQVESFDAVHQIVLETYFNPTRLGPKPDGIGWTDTYKSLRPKVEAASSVNVARGLTEQLIASIGESHFGLIPEDIGPQSQSEKKSSNASAETSADDSTRKIADTSADKPASKPATKSVQPEQTLGITLRIIAGEAIVFRVEANSAADKAGIRPGDHIQRIGRTRTNRRINEIEKLELPSAYQLLYLQSELDVDEGESKTLLISSGESKERNMGRKLTLAAAPSSVPVSKFGNLPPIAVDIETRDIKGVGYFRLGSFFDPGRVFGVYRNFIVEHQNAPGLIIDLRGNPGGIGAMAMGIANQLIDKPNLKLGTMITRDSRLNFVLNPQSPRFIGKVAVLVDEGSASTSEIFAAGLQDIGRARVFGQTTPGLALPSIVTKLPSGDAFQHATADYIREKGQRLEGLGVIPDETVLLDRNSLQQGRDPVIEAAIVWINSPSLRASTTVPATASTTNPATLPIIISPATTAPIAR